jgi:hypothetical protein
MLPGPHLRQIQMPDLIGAFLDPNAMAFFDSLRSLEQTELNRSGVLRKQGEVHPFAIPRSPQWIGMSWPSSHMILFSVNFMETPWRRSASWLSTREQCVSRPFTISVIPSIADHRPRLQESSSVRDVAA